MAITTIISSAQSRVKDSMAASPSVGLVLRANGEEVGKVIDARGNVYPAGFDAPTVAPTFANSGTGLTGYYAYVYVYASSLFPFVSATAINGNLFPRSNPSPVGTTALLANNGQICTVTKTTAVGIDLIWLFRTATYPTAIEATTAGEAGQAFYVGQAVNDGIAGTTTITDNNPIDSADQVELDNYVCPTFQFTVFYEPYWWGFGNLPFVNGVTWDYTTGIITLDAGATWFTGRNGQVFTLEGVTSGGFDGNGGYKFLWLTSTTAQATYDGVTPVSLPDLSPDPNAGDITIQGPATTLYRSKPKNPFAWGFTETIGDVNVPQEYAFNVGGGLGSAIAIVPNNPTLKLDTEYPARCYTLNLRSAGTSAFEGTLRIISDVYSVTSHFSQFAAVTSKGETVLWGMDFKNFAIVQSDGITQQPISNIIPNILRSLTQDRTRQLLTHGVYDPRTELNCMWVSTVNSQSLINYLIYQHAPSGFWGFSDEKDILSSATIQDTLTGNKKTFVGTQTGLLGQAFVKDVWANWIPDDGLFTGIVDSATVTSLTTNVSDTAFNTTEDGLVGNWVLVTDANGMQEQYARISAVSAHTLTFDWVRPLIGTGPANEFNPVPTNGFKFFIGLIECELLKYFDFNLPQTDKRLMELWLTQQGVDEDTQGTLIRFYRERENTYEQFAPLQVIYDNAEGSNVWYQETEIPSELIKMFGLKFINRGYQAWRFINLTLKPNIDP
jgi:hypothetical protein